MGQLDGKVALISGAGSGIGETIARLFSAEGAKVALGDINAESASAIAEDIGGIALPLDVREEDQWQAATAKTIDAFGKLNIVVNNAGISEPGSVEDETLEHWRHVHAINLDGAFLGSKYGIAAMKGNGETGAIVNIGSMLALRPGGEFAAYCSSKAAVTMMTKSMALHCAQAGYKIRCNVVHPGAIETPMLERYLEMTGLPHEEAYAMFAANHPMGRCGKPEEIAQAALFLCSDASSFTTGTDLTVDGGGFIRD